jgi:hypothetical protein
MLCYTHTSSPESGDLCCRQITRTRQTPARFIRRAPAFILCFILWEAGAQSIPGCSESRMCHTRLEYFTQCMPTNASFVPCWQDCKHPVEEAQMHSFHHPGPKCFEMACNKKTEEVDVRLQQATGQNPTSQEVFDEIQSTYPKTDESMEWARRNVPAGTAPFDQTLTAESTPVLGSLPKWLEKNSMIDHDAELRQQKNFFNSISVCCRDDIQAVH